MPTQSDGIVLILAPYARDGHSIAGVLQGQGLRTEIVSSLAQLSAALGDAVGAVILSEEALSQPDWSSLTDAVAAQPSWSAYPFILLISQRRVPTRPEQLFAAFPSEITNLIVLERPMGASTLLSAVRWALNGRRRQFVTRDHLDELERNTAQQRLLTRELAHRVKNTMAVLQSIVTQTLRPFPNTTVAKDLIVERFGALSRAHDLLLGSGFTSADFRELAERTFSIHKARFNLNGPTIHLSPQASLSFALVFHELATNSIKYGALQDGRGAVHLEWSVTPDTPSRLRLSWSEEGGPPVSPPQSQGFGTRLIRSTLDGLGDVTMTYPPSGFQLDFEGELSKLTQTEDDILVVQEPAGMEA